MSEFIDLTERKFSLLTVIQLHCGGHGLHLEWECICECGNKRIVKGYKLTSGHTKSCGCLKRKSSRFIDLTGLSFNLLTVVSIHSRLNRKVKWNCICKCGGTNIVQSSNLKNGAVKSCGCLGKTNLNNTTHGLTNTRLYNIWDNMKGRCYRPSMECFKYYGAKGITICDEWMNDCNTFFVWAMNNGYREDLTIERKKNELGYTPDNCEWIPQEEQSRNRGVALGVDKVIEIKKELFNGATCISLSKKYNVHPSTIWYIKSGKAYSYVTI